MIKGKAYYYAVRSARVNGKPRLVWQKYLGTADTIIDRMSSDSIPLPDASSILRFGAEAACLQVARELGIAAIIDEYLPKRHQGLTVGDYLLIAAINRCCDPRSKRAIERWFFGSVLSRHFPQVSPGDLSSQRFWDHMNLVTDEAIIRIESALSRRLLERYPQATGTLLYDTTNFYTFIHTFNQRCRLPERGHNKQKRYDLRQVNVALLVTRDGQLPLFHYCYEGSRPDSKSFQTIVGHLIQRLAEIAPQFSDLTIVYDTGNNSEAALTQLAASPCHFVSALPISSCPDLLTVPLERYRPLAGGRFEGVKVLRQEREVSGARRTVLVVFSPNFYRDQHKTMLIQLDQANRKLKELQDRLTVWENGLRCKGRRPVLESVERQVAEILSGQHLKELIVVTIELRRQFVHLEYRVDEDRLAELAERVFGKSLLFSDQRNWTDETLVGSYWDKWEIEAAFRQMKNRRHCGWFPMYHWTDQKIRVHAFYCVLALLINSVLQQKARQAGIAVETDELLTLLSGIHQVAYRYGRSKLDKPRTMISDRDEEQQKLTDEFELTKYA